MPFTEQSWRQSIKDHLSDFTSWLDERRRRQVPLFAYGALASWSLWPVAEAAIATSQAGQPLPIPLIVALGSVAGSVGGNLLANLVQEWKDSADDLTRDDIADQVVQLVEADPRYLEAFDAVVKNLELIPAALKKQNKAQRKWFTKALKQETASIGSALAQVVDQLVAIEVNTAATAQSTAETVEKIDNLTDVAEQILQHIQSSDTTLSSAERQQAIKRYLAYLIDRFRYLDFKGMGITDRVSFSLPLVDMYVPLKARAQLPEGETWARDLRFAGREPTADEVEAVGQRVGEPQPVLDLLREYGGLILLGDPGAGKTTFLKYLALRLAQGEGRRLGLGSRLPLLLPLSAYAAQLAKKDMPLDEFMAAYYRDRGVRLPFNAVVADALQNGSVLFLLDGLDEVQSLGQRHLVVNRVLDFVAFHKEAGNQFILTSRIVGYADVRRRDHDLIECTLADFDMPEIKAFVSKWSIAVERAVQGDTDEAQTAATHEQTELLAAMERNPGVRQLATNPLLLTILALMKRQGISLPERRVELYDQYVKTLIRHWNLARSIDRPQTRELDVVETIRVLGALALWMQRKSPGRGLVRQGETLRELTRIYKRRDHPQPEQAARDLLYAAREHAGMLVARGRYTYGFIHLTFQEYLAAVGIAQRGQSDLQPIVDVLAEHIGDASWREPSLLTIGYLGIIQQRDQAAGTVLERLIESVPGQPADAVILAGEAVNDVWPGGVTQHSRAVVVKAVENALVDVSIPVKQRARIGDVLANLGDTRPGVGCVKRDGILLPDIVWGKEVPPGTYTVGGDKGAHRSLEQQEIEIEHLYQLARYPVTYVQFQAFLDSADFNDPRWWQDILAREKEPGNQSWSIANRPRERVSWYQAIAFCRWLSDKLGQEIDLPHEYEWEVAARYPDGRSYPWGNEFDSTKANTREGDNLGETSAVGMYPGGSNDELELHDLSGNVWEWCRNSYGDPNQTEVGRASRTLRGGSWFSLSNGARAAARLYDAPHGRNYNFGFRVCVRRPPSQ